MSRLWLLAFSAVVSLILDSAICSTCRTATDSPVVLEAGARLAPEAEPPGDSEIGNVYAATLTNELAAAVAGVRPLVYVPNTRDASVDVIDPATLTVVDHFDVGTIPHHVTPSWDLRLLYVCNTQEDSLTVIDVRTAKPVATVPVVDPYNLYFTPDGTRAIVVAERFNRIDVRDPHTWALLGSVPIPGNGPDHLDFTADGRELLISTEFDGNLYRVDPYGLRVTGRLHLGGLPVDVRVSPDGSVFYVANQGRHGVSVVDPVEMREIEFLPTGRGAHGLVVSRDARSLYVSNRLAGSISIIELAARRVTATWQVGGSPDMLQVSPDGSQLWTAHRYHHAVIVIDTASGKVLHRIRVGRGPHGLTYFPQPGRFSLGHNGVYR